MIRPSGKAQLERRSPQVPARGQGPAHLHTLALQPPQASCPGCPGAEGPGTPELEEARGLVATLRDDEGPC